MKKFPNLKCHIILSSDLLENQDKNYLKCLKECYENFNYLITDRIYRFSPDFLSEENHIKMLVVDGAYFVMGGTGIHEKMTREDVPIETSSSESVNSKFIDKAFRDTDVVGHGEVAQTMRNQFFNLYRIWERRMTGTDIDRYFASNVNNAGRCELFHESDGLIRAARMKYLVCGPEHRQKNPISEAIAQLVKGANKNIKIANLLFNPDENISNALKYAKNKKIDIKGYFNGTGGDSSSAHYLYALPNRHNYDLISHAYEYKKKGQLYHKKVMTIDDRYTVIGSFNLGKKSAGCDHENVFIIDNNLVAEKMNANLNEDGENSNHLTGEKLISKKRWNQIPSLFIIGVLGSLFG